MGVVVAFQCFESVKISLKKTYEAHLLKHIFKKLFVLV